MFRKSFLLLLLINTPMSAAIGRSDDISNTISGVSKPIPVTGKTEISEHIQLPCKKQSFWQKYKMPIAITATAVTTAVITFVTVKYFFSKQSKLTENKVNSETEFLNRMVDLRNQFLKGPLRMAANATRADHPEFLKSWNERINFLNQAQQEFQKFFNISEKESKPIYEIFFSNSTILGPSVYTTFSINRTSNSLDLLYKK